MGVWKFGSAAVLGVAALVGPARAADRPVALTHVRLIDGSGAAPVDDATVVVSGSAIVAAGPSSTPVPPDAEVRDYRGKTVIPGLVADHSHVGQVSGVTIGGENYTRPVVEAELRQYRRYGVTTVNALGNNGPIFQELRADAHAGKLDGADLFGVVRAIGTPDGAPSQATIHLNPDQIFRPSTEAEARGAVAFMAELKTDMVKIWVDDFGGSLKAKMGPDLYRAVIDESHRRGLRVAAHIHDLADAKAILAAGADILAHGVRDVPVDSELIEALKARDAWYIPTLQLDESTFAWAEQAPWTRTPFARAALSPELARQVDDPAWRAKTLAGPGVAGARASLAMNLRNLKTLHDAGVRIGFGTDSGAIPPRVAGIAEHRELALMVEAGLSPLRALTVATADAASLMRRHDRGRIAPGLRADLVVLDADPSEAIANTQTVREVWAFGRPSPWVEAARPR